MILVQQYVRKAITWSASATLNCCEEKWFDDLSLQHETSKPYENFALLETEASQIRGCTFGLQLL